jgi:hypothetical protein
LVLPKLAEIVIDAMLDEFVENVLLIIPGDTKINLGGSNVEHAFCEPVEALHGSGGVGVQIPQKRR